MLTQAEMKDERIRYLEALVDELEGRIERALSHLPPEEEDEPAWLKAVDEVLNGWST
jgi:hypothetical protein